MLLDSRVCNNQQSPLYFDWLDDYYYVIKMHLSTYGRQEKQGEVSLYYFWALCVMQKVFYAVNSSMCSLSGITCFSGQEA